MIFRTIALSLALLIGIGAIIPLTTNYSEAGTRKYKRHKKKHKKYKKYSKKWFRQYNYHARKRKTLKARKRMLRLRQIRLSNARTSTRTNMQKRANIASPNQIEELFILVEGKVKNVYNGDTINLETKDGKSYLIRMLGIDAPKIRQDFGSRSQNRLSNLILRKNVTVIIRRRNLYNLYIGTVYYAGQDINLKQIETGMARYLQQKGYEARENDRAIYKQAEEKSRYQGKGLWMRRGSNAVLGFQKRQRVKKFSAGI
jgi:endonuclease YncB( thermonuclease family)